MTIASSRSSLELMEVTRPSPRSSSLTTVARCSTPINIKNPRMIRQLKLFLLASPIALQAQVTVDWNQPVSGLAVALDQSNNVFTVNYAAGLGGDITLIKRNSAGTELWQASYDQTSTTMFDRATWVATDQLGNAVVTGTVMSGFSNPVNANSLVMKFSPSGTMLWRQVYESLFDGSYTKKCVVDKANNIYVFGVGTGPNGQVTQVKKFAPNGSALWSWFDPVGIGAPVNIKFTPEMCIRDRNASHAMAGGCAKATRLRTSNAAKSRGYRCFMSVLVAQYGEVAGEYI